MTGQLMPRLDVGQTMRRFHELEEAARAGHSLADYVIFDDGLSAPNPTGGVVVRRETLEAAREGVLRALATADERNAHRDDRSRRLLKEAHLGKALDTYLPLILSDAGHNEVWCYLSLMIFPDVVLDRWPLTRPGRQRPAGRRAIEERKGAEDGAPGLPIDRWIGDGTGRDRNYLRTSWRRWRLFGELLMVGDPPLGEDELVGLTERSSMARNRELVAVCARTVLSYDRIPEEHRRDRNGGPLGRSAFTRLLTRAVVLSTGPRLLDVLSPQELRKVVRDAARNVMPAAADWFRGGNGPF